MSRKKSTRDTNFDRRVRQELRRSQVALLITEVASVFNTLIRWACPCAAIAISAYFLGGKETGVKLEGLFSAFANQWVYLAVAGLCGGGWYVERRTLRRRIREMSDEKRTLESLLDPRDS